MSSARLNPCIRLPLSPEVLEEITSKAKDWLVMHGACMRSKHQLNTDEVHHAPFVLLPTSFPRDEFKKAIEVQEIINELMNTVAHDHEFLTATLKSTIEVDDFTAKLFEIYQTVLREGFEQKLSLGLIRSDYLLHSLEDTTIKQVEVNTIASSFAGIATCITDYHRYILQELDHESQLKNIPENNALSGLCDGLVRAWELYNVESAVILFVVEDTTLNICDQRFHEFEIRKKNSKIKILRKSLGELASEARLGQVRDLIVGDFTVAVVYFRSGYEPAQYPTQKEWEARLLIEKSSAIKCPSIHYHLAGTKKVQQELATPGALERFLKDQSISEKIRNVFTGLYSLDFNMEGEKAVEMGLKDPNKYVLKPQREGGGNNVYGEAVRQKLEVMKDSKERTAWILMDCIRPPLQETYIIRPGNPNEAELQDVITELGIYGVIIGSSNTIKMNKQVGHLLRSKPASANEGGVVMGVGALDSPYLIS
ncbi:glutathione synthetase-like [Athalia rosae]|uniref:glutathione synthetase-like n=1 Tax=Athalia rosae TaxID=37344 RepID=UPI0020344854|nr:glutathione synthetase-like [Athalia rosae]